MLSSGRHQSVEHLEFMPSLRFLLYYPSAKQALAGRLVTHEMRPNSVCAFCKSFHEGLTKERPDPNNDQRRDGFQRERERGCLTVFASVGFIYAECPRRDTRGIIGPRSTRLIFRDGRHEDDATLHRTWQFSFVQDSHCLRRDVVSFNASITAAQRIVGLGKD